MCYFVMGQRVSTPHRIGIRELRQHASRWVQLAEDGERVEITNRGRLVAALVPIDEDEDLWTRLERQGRLTRPTGRVADLPPPAPLPPGSPDSTAIIRELRRDRT